MLGNLCTTELRLLSTAIDFPCCGDWRSRQCHCFIEIVWQHQYLRKWQLSEHQKHQFEWWSLRQLAPRNAAARAHIHCSRALLQKVGQNKLIRHHSAFQISVATFWPLPHHTGGLAVRQDRKSCKCILGSAGQECLGALYSDCRGAGEWRKQHGIWRNLCVWQLYFTALPGCCWEHFLLSLLFSGNTDFGMNLTLV